MTVIMGICRLGFLESILSKQLLRGFILAVSIVVIIEQMSNLLGIEVQGNASPLWRLVETMRNTPNINWPTFGISVFASSFLITAKLLKKKYRLKVQWITYVPDILILVILTISINTIFHLEKYGVRILGDNAMAQWVAPRFPSPTLENVRVLISTAFMITMVGFVETVVTVNHVM
jgi:MFS superfamily sulfate permease-like transporter